MGTRVAGILETHLRAKTGQFDIALTKAAKMVARFAGQVPGLNLLLSRAGAIAGGVTAAGLGYLAKKTADSIDASAKLADRIGTSTERLEGLRHAAELAGGGTEGMDRALEMMTKRLGEARSGTGETAAGLKTLGLEIEDLLGQDPADQFSAIADRIASLATQQDKAAAAAKIFGREGTQLVNVLELGSKGLEEMQKDAERLGLTFDRVDAAKVEAANDALTRVHNVIQGALRRGVIALAPYVEAVADKLVDVGTSGEGLGPKVVSTIEGATLAAAKFTESLRIIWATGKAAFGFLIVGAGTVTKAFAEMVEGIADVGDWLNLDVFDLRRAGFGMKQTGGQWADFGQGIVDDALKAFDPEAAQERIKGIEEFFDDIRNGALAAAKKAAGGRRSGGLAAGEGGEEGPTDREQRHALKAFEEMEKRYSDELAILEKRNDKERERAEIIVRSNRIQQEFVNELAPDLLDVDERRLDNFEAMLRRLKALQLAELDLRELRRVGDDVANGIVAPFEDAANALGEAEVKIREVLRAIVLNLRQVALKELVFDPMREWISGMFVMIRQGLAGLFGGGAAAPAAPGATPSFALPDLGAAKGAALSGSRVRKFAKGGLFPGPTFFPLPGGGLGLAGEGPDEEGILPLARDRAGRLGVRGGGGGDTYVTMNIHTPDSDSFRRSERQMVRAARRAFAVS